MSERPWKAALGWIAVLGALFFSTYGLANWAASVRGDVGSVVYGWEHSIPFWAWTIVPYWSIDAFYGISLLVCATRPELNAQVKRLLAAQAIAVTCFLLWPLTFTFERPATSGVFGWMFDALTGFDKPFNQAPSLHVVLLVILWARFVQHLPRWSPQLSRGLLDIWFALIALSVLTTYQHHFIDLPTGWLAGWLCVWLFPDGGQSVFARARLTTDPRRRRIGAWYALGALGAGALAFAIGGAALWLLWPATSLALVALVYLALDARAFEKGADGRMSTAAWWLFGPYFIGAWINSRLWTREDERMDQVVPGVWLGRAPTSADLDTHGIRAVVDLTAELPLSFIGFGYHNIPTLDLIPPTASELAAAVRAIEAATVNGPALVCCALGYSRSSLACAAWLIASGRAANAEAAVALIRKARPRIVLREHHRALLAALES